MPHKYIYIIFAIVLIITTFIAAFVLAENSDKFIDSDTDGLSDYDEKEIYYTLADNPDTDNDGFIDGAEVRNGYSPKQQKLKMDKVDSDNDGLNDEWEIRLGTNIMSSDTDNDSYSDGTEVLNNFSPTDPK